jgi:hypothetical protein
MNSGSERTKQRCERGIDFARILNFSRRINFAETESVVKLMFEVDLTMKEGVRGSPLQNLWNWRDSEDIRNHQQRTIMERARYFVSIVVHSELCDKAIVRHMLSRRSLTSCQRPARKQASAYTGHPSPSKKEHNEQISRPEDPR